MGTWTRVKFPKGPSKSAFKTRNARRLRVVFKNIAGPSKKVYKYIVKEEVTPVRIVASHQDANDSASMVPRHFSLTPGMILTSQFNKQIGNSVGYLQFGLLHAAAGNANARTYIVTVHADTLGNEIVRFDSKRYINSMSRSLRPAGSRTPEHPSRHPNSRYYIKGGGGTRRRRI